MGTRLLQYPTILHLHEPPPTALQIAFFRIFFAGLFFLPWLRRGDLTFAPVMLPMVATFAAMNGLFISAMAYGTSANAIWLQYTAPFWVALFAMVFLKEPADRRTTHVLMVGLLGVGVILVGSWWRGPVEQLPVIGMALGSGITYAGVLICLRAARAHSSAWLTSLNHVGGALLLLPWIWGVPLPTPGQLAFLALFGIVQMALPYWLMARSLRTLSSQEAGLIVLLEPILNPIWAWLLVPERELPRIETWLGAGLILAGLIWRYTPRRRSLPARVTP